VLRATQNRFYLPKHLPSAPAPAPFDGHHVNIWRKRSKINAKYACLPVGRLFAPTATAKTMTYQGRNKRLLSSALFAHSPALSALSILFSLPWGQWQLSLQFCNQLPTQG